MDTRVNFPLDRVIAVTMAKVQSNGLCMACRATMGDFIIAYQLDQDMHPAWAQDGISIICRKCFGSCPAAVLALLAKGK